MRLDLWLSGPTAANISWPSWAILLVIARTTIFPRPLPWWFSATCSAPIAPLCNLYITIGRLTSYYISIYYRLFFLVETFALTKIWLRIISESCDLTDKAHNRLSDCAIGARSLRRSSNALPNILRAKYSYIIYQTFFTWMPKQPTHDWCSECRHRDSKSLDASKKMLSQCVDSAR